MKTYYTVSLAMAVGFGLGAVAVGGLHAQAKPPAIVVSEIDVQKPDEYAKEYVPHAQKLLSDGGGKYLAASSNITSIAGTPPKRVSIVEFENIEKAQAVFGSAAYKEHRKIGDKYATFRIYVMEGRSR